MPGVRQRLHVDRAQPALGRDAQRPRADAELQAHVGEAGEQVLHVLGPGVADRQLAAGHGDGGEVRRGLDAVGHGAVADGAQRTALDAAHDEP